MRALLPPVSISWLIVSLALAVLVILLIAAFFALDIPLESDGLAYSLMAEAMASGSPPVDQHGQPAFYSIGSPLWLTPFYALLGPVVNAALVANLVLAAGSGLLVYAIARTARIPRAFAILAIVAFALWMPGIWNGAQIAKENLSAPLLLLVVLASMKILETLRTRWLLIAGLSYGLGILTGGSTLLVGAVPLLALWMNGRKIDLALGKQAAKFASAAVLAVIPWLVATSLMLDSPTLNTNGGFNLYLGNNPAATGEFVSIHKTPAGKDWEALRTSKGEAGASDELADRAKTYIGQNPARTIGLGVRKLLLFWTPNFPDAVDAQSNPLIAKIRIVEVTQYLLLLCAGFAGLAVALRDRRHGALLGVAIAGFWLLHAAAYIIPRYRDPLMPILIVGAVALVAQLWEKRPIGILTHVS